MTENRTQDSMGPENADADGTTPGAAATPPAGNALRNRVVGGDPRTAPRCGARTRAGTPCKGPRVRGREQCKFHGGMSTGPRTPAGIESLRTARTVHGGFGAELKEFLVQLRETRMEAAIAVAAALQRYVDQDEAARAAAAATPNTDDGEPK